MTAITICTILSTIIGLLLIQKVTMRLILSDGYSITVDYFFLTLTLKKGIADKKRRPKRKHKPTVGALMRMILRVIRSSKITVNQIKIPISVADPFRSAITRGGTSSGIYPILNLLLSYAQNASFAEDALKTEQNYGGISPALDIVLQTELYNICFSGIILLYEELKRRIIRSNVRKPNE